VATVFEQWARISNTAQKLAALEDLLRRATALEAKYIVKIIGGDLRIGLRESLVEEAIAKAFDCALPAVQRANMLLGDIRETLRLAAENKLEQARMRLFHPIGFMLASPAAAQIGEPRWEKEFPEPVSWFARTSPGILLVRAGKSLTALDPLDGRQLWSFPDVKILVEERLSPGAVLFRASNILEVPGTGVLLLNDASFPNDSQRRLIALNLVTGERLWVQPAKGVHNTAFLTDHAPEAILVATRFLYRESDFLPDAAYSSVSSPLGEFLAPYRVAVRRFDFLTGKIEWNTEYPRSFPPWPYRVVATGDRLFLSAGNRIVGTIDPANGNRLREDRAKTPHPHRPSLPVLHAGGLVIYALKDVQAVDPINGKPAWAIRDLGTITDIALLGGLMAALGDSHLAVVDAQTGKELWRQKTHGHTTNLLWDKQSGAILYVDGAGLHSTEVLTGKSLLNASLKLRAFPILISLASSDVLVTLADEMISAYNFRTGRKLFDAGRPFGFFSSAALLDVSQQPWEGEHLNPWSTNPLELDDRLTLPPGSLFTQEWRSRVTNFLGDSGSFTNAYETESATGYRTVWWIDPKTNQKVEMGVAGTQHDVSLSMGMIFAVDGNKVWGAEIKAK
jgi:outer membrane protein assembly factor BamB